MSGSCKTEIAVAISSGAGTPSRLPVYGGTSKRTSHGSHSGDRQDPHHIAVHPARHRKRIFRIRDAPRRRFTGTTHRSDTPGLRRRRGSYRTRGHDLRNGQDVVPEKDNAIGRVCPSLTIGFPNTMIGVNSHQYKEENTLLIRPKSPSRPFPSLNLPRSRGEVIHMYLSVALPTPLILPSIPYICSSTGSHRPPPFHLQISPRAPTDGTHGGRTPWRVNEELLRKRRRVQLTPHRSLRRPHHSRILPSA